ncbi:MAG: hypothetical protein HKN16_05600 [Saprospiraceae bacterium]|nr:hypothetical protein [Saprospiraceae bacterium]
MSRSVTTIFFLLITLTTFAQRVTVSEEIPLRSDDGYSLLGKFKSHILVFRSESGDKFEVQSLDEKMRISWKKDIELDKKNPNLLDVISYNDHFYLFYTYRSKGNVFLKAAKFDAAANLRDSTTIKNLGSSWYAPKFRVVSSEDRSRVVFYKVEKQSYFDLYSFDLSSMELRWENKIRPDRYLDQKDFEQAFVDNRGNFYFIQEKDNRKIRMDDHRVEIYSCNGPGEANRKNTALAIPDYLFYDIIWKYDNVNKQMTAGGMYSINNRSRANGYFMLSIDVWNDRDYFFQTTEFTDDFIAGIAGKGLDEEKGISEIEVRDLVLRRDGGFMIFFERTKITERRLASGSGGYVGRNGTGFIVDHYYDDVIALSLNPDGSYFWHDVLHKKQYSQDDGAVYSSFFTLTTPSRIRLLFNDDIKSETTVSEYVVRADGQSDRNALLSTDDQELRLRFQDALQITSNEVIVPSEKRNRLKLVRVTY